ncbi:uncharacterized protein LOC135335470 isoform X6 [Halichondria panicea]|uniref:uncharacterized protein LOC135335470 isoform X6 n=1 Tax=Halichondria panicea TaxID=6063 RepID=UPI00312B62D6
MVERGSDKRKLSPQLSTPTASTETRYRSRLKQHEKLPPSRIIAQQSRDSPRLSLSTVHQNSQEPLRSSFACSSRVRKVLSKDYTTPKEAQTALMALTSKLPARVSSEPQALSISYGLQDKAANTSRSGVVKHTHFSCGILLAKNVIKQ